MTVFEPITSQRFETTLSQNNVVSTSIKRDWFVIIYVNGILSKLLAANATDGWTMKLLSDTNEFPFYRSAGFSFMVINFIVVLLYLN